MRTLAIALALMPAVALAQYEIIDFETLPNGDPMTEDMLIHDQYAEWGVLFELIGVDPSVGPRVGKVGPPRTSYTGVSRSEPGCGVNSSTSSDMPAAGQEVGCFFLTDDNIHNNSYYGLRVTYLSPVLRAYGELMDIDYTEIWTIRALDAAGGEIASTVIRDNDPGTGNGISTPWEFDVTTPIHAIELIPDTVNSHAFGLAFDNFSPSSIPHYPVCDAGGPYVGDPGEPIQFDGSGSYDTDGEIVAWRWDFGDGTTSDEMSPVHSYAEEGEYGVVLCVTDDEGNESCCSPEGGDVLRTEGVSWSEVKALYR